MRLLTTLFALIPFLATSCKNEGSSGESGHAAEAHEDIEQSSPDIPESMTEAILSLDALLTDEEKRKLQLTMIGEVDPFDEEDFFNIKALKITLRNDWRLWTGSKLKDYFTERGITHGDWISEAILEGWIQRQKTGFFNEKAIITKYSKMEADSKEGPIIPNAFE